MHGSHKRCVSVILQLSINSCIKEQHFQVNNVHVTVDDVGMMKTSKEGRNLSCITNNLVLSLNFKANPGYIHFRDRPRSIALTY